MNNEEIMALSVLVCERRMGADANVEYTLPEYFPEIRKLLRVEPCLMQPTCYVSSSAAQVSGSVDYRIIYVGADGEIYSAPVSTEYSANAPIDTDERIDASLGLEMTCTPSIESLTARVSGPRRVGIRARIRCNVRVLGRISLCEEVLGEVNPMRVYKQRNSCKSAEYCSAGSDITELECDLAALADGVRIVDASAKAFVQEVGARQGGVYCRGEVMLSVLELDENTREYVSVCKKLPFECNVEADTVVDGASVRARGVVSEVRIDVEEDRVSCKIGICLDVKCFCNKEVEYTADLYSSERECRTAMAEYEGAYSMICRNANFTVSERFSSDSVGIPSDAKVIASFGSAVVDGVSKDNGKLVLDGHTRIAVICGQGGEYTCTELDIPFRYSTDADDGADGEISCFEACADVISIRATNESSGFGLDAELALSVDCMGSCRISAVDVAELGEIVKREPDALTVCYPASDDTLWSIAKRYRVAPCDVSGDPTVDKYVIIE